MKKIMVTGLALLTLVPAAAQAQSGPAQRAWRDAQREFRQERREFRQERREDRREDRRDDRREFRDERREHREAREARREWLDEHRRHRDHRGYNYGYSYVQPHYYHPQPTYRYYAPPPPAYYYPPTYYGGYSSYHAPARWYRGQVLPHHYRRYAWNDYHRYGYAPPPYGYSYYRTNTGDIILAAIATGLILSVFAGAW